MPMSNFLNQDIIEEILSRLPVKSLIRFKCVCKSWNGLISSRHGFARLQLERASETKILTSTHSGLKLLAYETCFGGEIGLDFPPRTQDHVLRIMGSSHGLVAVALESDRGFYIWNPLTGDYKELPDPCFPSSKFLDDGYVPMYDDSKFNGFGYDSSTDDYKLFFGVEKSWWPVPVVHTERWETMVSIFSLRKNSWRMIKPPPTNSTDPLFVHGRSSCSVNGALHWVSGTPTTEEILAFDLKTETFSMLPVPNEGEIEHVIMTMGVLNGKLCVTFDSSGSCSPVELWVMEEYGVEQSWNKLLTIDETHTFQTLYLPLCITEGKQVVLINEARDLIRYGADESIVEKFRFCRSSKDTHHCRAIVYAESLISPNVNIIEDEECRSSKDTHHCRAIVYAESLISPNVNIIEDEERNQGRNRKR